MFLQWSDFVLIIYILYSEINVFIFYRFNIKICKEIKGLIKCLYKERLFGFIGYIFYFSYSLKFDVLIYILQFFFFIFWI